MMLLRLWKFNKHTIAIITSVFVLWWHVYDFKLLCRYTRLSVKSARICNFSLTLLYIRSYKPFQNLRYDGDKYDVTYMFIYISYNIAYVHTLIIYKLNWTIELHSIYFDWRTWYSYHSEKHQLSKSWNRLLLFYLYWQFKVSEIETFNGYTLNE